MPLQKSKKKKKKSTKDKDGSVSQNVKQSVVVNVGGGSVDSSKKKKRTGRPRGSGKLSRPAQQVQQVPQQIFSPPNYPQRDLVRVVPQPPEPAQLTPSIRQSQTRPSLNSMMSRERVSPPSMANPLNPPPMEPASLSPAMGLRPTDAMVRERRLSALGTRPPPPSPRVSVALSPAPPDAPMEPSQLTPEIVRGRPTTDQSVSRRRSKTPSSPRVRFEEPPMEPMALTIPLGEIPQLVGETIGDRSISTQQRLMDTERLADIRKQKLADKSASTQREGTGLRRSNPSSTIGSSPLSHGFVAPEPEENPLFPPIADVYNDERTPDLSVVKPRSGDKKKRRIVIIDTETGEKIPAKTYFERKRMGGEDFDAPSRGEMLGDAVRDEFSREAIAEEQRQRLQRQKELEMLEEYTKSEMFQNAFKSPSELTDVRRFLGYYVPAGDVIGETPEGIEQVDFG
tara:strand:- start:2064 stop:3425 length:1362 start_codon:yes stop_codon:yes gene_type:complete